MSSLTPEDKQWLSDVPESSSLWAGHNGPSGPMKDVSFCDIRAEAMEAYKAAGEPTSHRTFWPTLHNMTEKAKAMYEIFCEARAITRATADGQANASEFFEVGKEQGDILEAKVKAESEGGSGSGSEVGSGCGSGSGSEGQKS
jgi:hypothetical protein